MVVPRSEGLWRPSRCLGADRELSRLSDRDIWAGSGRARLQSSSEIFGAEIAIPLKVTSLDCGIARSNVFTLSNERASLANGRDRSGCSLSSAGYRESRPVRSNNGVPIGPLPSKPASAKEDEVALVGGGNSAGQAVVVPRPEGERLHLIIRRSDLTATMSRYLIDRIAALPNVEIHAETEVLALEGDKASGLTGAVFRNRTSGDHASPRAAASVPVHRCRTERGLAGRLRRRRQIRFREDGIVGDVMRGQSRRGSPNTGDRHGRASLRSAISGLDRRKCRCRRR